MSNSCVPLPSGGAGHFEYTVYSDPVVQQLQLSFAAPKGRGLQAALVATVASVRAGFSAKLVVPPAISPFAGGILTPGTFYPGDFGFLRVLEKIRTRRGGWAVAGVAFADESRSGEFEDGRLYLEAVVSLALPRTGVVDPFSPPGSGVVDPVSPPGSGVVDPVSPPGSGVVDERYVFIFEGESVAALAVGGSVDFLKPFGRWLAVKSRGAPDRFDVFDAAEVMDIGVDFDARSKRATRVLERPAEKKTFLSALRWNDKPDTSGTVSAGGEIPESRNGKLFFLDEGLCVCEEFAGALRFLRLPPPAPNPALDRALARTNLQNRTPFVVDGEERVWFLSEIGDLFVFAPDMTSLGKVSTSTFAKGFWLFFSPVLFEIAGGSALCVIAMDVSDGSFRTLAIGLPASPLRVGLPASPLRVGL